MDQAAIKRYWEERLKKDYSLGGVGCLPVSRYYNYWLYKMRQHQLRKTLKKLNISRNSQCLDVGSGTGFYIEQFLQNGYTHITGSDFTSVAFEKLKEKFPSLEIWNMDIGSNMSEPAHNFQLVTCMDVLFHIVDDAAYDNAIKNLSGFLEKDGCLILTENFTPYIRDRVHIYDREQRHVIALLKQHGLEIKQTYSPFIFLNPPMQSNNKFLWWISDIRISVLKTFVALRMSKINWLIGMVLYYLDRSLLAIGIKGSGTSMIICKKN